MELTDGLHKIVEGCVGKERLWKLPEKHLQSTGGHMDILPLIVFQVYFFIYRNI